VNLDLLKKLNSKLENFGKSFEFIMFCELANSKPLVSPLWKSILINSENTPSYAIPKNDVDWKLDIFGTIQDLNTLDPNTIYFSNDKRENAVDKVDLIIPYWKDQTNNITGYAFIQCANWNFRDKDSEESQLRAKAVDFHNAVTKTTQKYHAVYVFASLFSFENFVDEVYDINNNQKKRKRNLFEEVTKKVKTERLVILEGSDFDSNALLYPFKALKKIHIEYQMSSIGKFDSNEILSEYLFENNKLNFNFGITQASNNFHFKMGSEKKEVDLSTVNNVGELSIKLVDKFGVDHVAIKIEGKLHLDPKKTLDFL